MKQAYNISLLLVAGSLFLSLEQAYAVETQLPKNRCEVIGLFNNCPAHTDVYSGGEVRYDNENGSATNEVACKARAESFYQWCKAKKPIASKFYSGGNLVSETVFPKR
jgi:hypothetical protein